MLRGRRKASVAERYDHRTAFVHIFKFLCHEYKGLKSKDFISLDCSSVIHPHCIYIVSINAILPMGIFKTNSAMRA